MWSPDSRFIAYPKHLPSLFRALFLYDVESGQKRQITDGLAGAVSLRAQVNHKLVGAENGGAAPRSAPRDAIGPWEQFDLIEGVA